MSATVTVVVRTRNRPAMLTRALASIASQSFDDYEVVIVNDAGDEAEVREIVKKHKRGLERPRGRARVGPGGVAQPLLRGPRR